MGASGILAKLLGYMVLAIKLNSLCGYTLGVYARPCCALHEGLLA